MYNDCVIPTFLSRRDDSGTHVREKKLWQMAGVQPAGDWYLEAGRGMGEVLIASYRKGGEQLFYVY